MKKRKAFGLYGTNKRKTAKRADKYTEEFYETYEEADYAEEEFAEEYADGEYGCEETVYTESGYAEEFTDEYADGEYEGVTFADDDCEEEYEGAVDTDSDYYTESGYAEEFADEYADGEYEGVTFADDDCEEEYEGAVDTEPYTDALYENADDTGSDYYTETGGAEEYAEGYTDGAYEDTGDTQELSGEYASEECIPEEYASEEYIPEEYASEEYIPEEYASEEYIPEEYASEEYIPEEYASEEYVSEEYESGEYTQNAYAEEVSGTGGAYTDDYEDGYDGMDDETGYENETGYGNETGYENAYEDAENSFETAYGDSDAPDMYDMYEEDEVAFGPELRGGFGERLREWFSNMTAFDVILASTGVLLLVAVAVAGSMYLETKRVNERIEALVPMGEELAEIGIVGEDGLVAMTNSALSGQFAAELESETVSSIVDAGEESNAPEAVSDKVNVNFTSVEKDLKIRFTDANTGELITGTAFEVVLTNAKGKKLVLTDDDMDGIIYAQNVNPGKFDVVITSTDKYKFPTLAQQVTVKDKVEYVVIRDVQDEVKKESQVNVAAEDTQKQDAQKEEEQITDTVEWVESTQTLLSGTESYLAVDKNTIEDPSKTARAAARMLFDTLNVTLDKTELSLTVGSSADLAGTKFTDSTEGDITYKYKTEWKSSNESVATVSDGKVTAKSAGTAEITYTVTRTTITTVTEEGTPKTSTETEEKTMSEAEFETYKKEIEGKSDAEYQVTVESKEAVSGEGSGETADSGAETASGETRYKYRITITKTEKGESTTSTKETTDTGSAKCKVTVEAAKITSAALELSKSAESCSVGGTLTVKPSKLVYTKENGTKEEAASFPTVTWSSSDKAVATVDANGVVTGVKEGKVTITATISGVKGAGGKEIPISATTTVTVSAAPALTLKLDRTEDVSLNVGGQTTLVATVTNYKSDAGVVWETSDKKIATVSEAGVVTGVAPGKATITATTKEKGADGNPLKATCVVTVNSNAASDTTTKLKDKNGNQIYVRDGGNGYKEAVYADYFTASEFFIRTEGQYAYTGWQTIGGKRYYYDKNGNAVTGTQVIQGVTYNFDSTGAIATSVNGTTFGIDISRHNGNIDWNAVKASGVDYVIIRCGYRGSATGVLIEDESFKKNIKGATAAGLKVGIYVFSQAVDEVEAVKEASLAVSLAKGYNLTYPIFIDTESSGGRADKIDTATRTAVVNAFCQTVASAGYQPGIYASKTWFETKLNMGAIGNYRIWLAQYAAAPSYKGRYDMWQYSSKGTISGISGKVDLNLSYLGY
ncbi:MAG: Ig-like domain-containing protein [Roseburia sp.]|nr:Ig-like domain-containing protein [Roseburia sp.]